MAGDYGFTLDVKGNSVQQMKLIEEAVKKLGGTVKSATSEISDGFASLGESARELQNHLIEAFSVYEVYNFGKELLHLTAEFQGFENVIKYSSLGIVDNARNVDYLNDAVDRLHLPLKEATQSFSEMQAGMVGTGIEGDKLRKLFEGVSEAASVMHLNPEAFSRTTFALKEIGELGTLQARQLRMLSFALPGAGQLAAQAMGVSMEKLHEQMKKGEIHSDVFLPKFAEALTMHFNPGLQNAGHSLIAQINDEKNEVLKSMLDMGNSLMPLWSDILKTTIEFMRDIQSLWKGLTGNSDFINFLKSVFDWAAKLIPIWITYKAVMGANALLTGVFAVENGILTASMGELTVMTDGSTFAFEGLSAAIAGTGIGALVIGIGLLVEHLISMNQQLDEAIDKKYKLTESKNDFKSMADQANAIKEQYAVFNQLDASGKKKLAEDVGEFLKENRNKIPLINQRATHLNAGAQKSVTPTAGDKAIHFASLGGYDLSSFLSEGTKTSIKTKDAAAEMSGNLKGLGSNFVAIKDIAEALKKQGLKPGSYASDLSGSGGSGKDQAYSTSNLAGASGGLGQAKNIHISIGVVQQNNGVKESKNESDEAVQKIIEALNGFSDSQNAQ